MNIFETPSGERVIAQRPNPPIIVAFVLWGAAVLTEGDISELLSVLSGIAFVTWALMEIFWGVNIWRRSLGAAVLVWTVSAFV